MRSTRSQISQSVTDALKAIEQKLFDVYVMDYKLPDGTGLDVAEQIQSKGSEAPIILISGYDPSSVAVRAEELRISDIIEKPFSRATICDAVKKASESDLQRKGEPGFGKSRLREATGKNKEAIFEGRHLRASYFSAPRGRHGLFLLPIHALVEKGRRPDESEWGSLG